jgi:proteasome lid subunit RPN8/RPN11
VPGALKISDDLAARIRVHAAETYPHECCGALLGREGDDGREVLALVPLENRRDDSPRNRFSITPEDVRLAEQKAREQGIDLIGWYHSHPDHPAAPSEFDREHAWPWYSYIIVRSEAQGTKEMASWRLADDRASYASEPIETSAPVAMQRQS